MERGGALHTGREPFITLEKALRAALPAVLAGEESHRVKQQEEVHSNFSEKNKITFSKY